MGDATGFRFEAVDDAGKPVAGMGDLTRLAKGMKLVGKTQLPAHVRLIRHGKVVGKSEGASECAFDVSEPGAYRLEAWLKLDGEWRHWILSNPIYVR
jgi:hypothetical protein